MLAVRSWKACAASLFKSAIVPDLAVRLPPVILQHDNVKRMDHFATYIMCSTKREWCGWQETRVVKYWGACGHVPGACIVATADSKACIPRCSMLTVVLAELM